MERSVLKEPQNSAEPRVSKIIKNPELAFTRFIGVASFAVPPLSFGKTKKINHSHHLAIFISQESKRWACLEGSKRTTFLLMKFFHNCSLN